MTADASEAVHHSSARFSYAITSSIGGIGAVVYIPPSGVGGNSGLALKAALMAITVFCVFRSLRLRVAIDDGGFLIIANIFRTHRVRLDDVADVGIKRDFFQPGVWITTVAGHRIRPLALAAVRGLWKPGFPHPGELQELESAARVIAKWAGNSAAR